MNEQCHAALVQIKGPNKPKDAFAAGADLPDSLGAGSVKEFAGETAKQVFSMPLSALLMITT